MMRFILFLNLLIGLAIAFPDYAVAAANYDNATINNKKPEKSGLVSGGTKIPAKIKRDIAPSYPKSAARDGREAVVTLTYGITAEGEVENVEVIEVFTHKDYRRKFANAAIRAVKKWQYIPASIDGNNVYSCANELTLTFSLGSKKKVTSNFLSQYSELEKHLNAGDSEQATKSLKVLELGASNAYELVYLYNITASYHQLNQSPILQIEALEKVLKSGGKQQLDAASYKNTLLNLFILQTTNKQYANALKTFWKIRGAKFPTATFEELKAVKNSIQKKIRSDEELVYNGEIGEDRNFSQHTLSRSNFSLHDFHGDITKMELRCGFHFQRYKLSAEKLWKIPEAWGKCDVLVFGETGSQFTLVEHTNLPS